MYTVHRYSDGQQVFKPVRGHSGAQVIGFYTRIILDEGYRYNEFYARDVQKGSDAELGDWFESLAMKVDDQPKPPEQMDMFRD